MPKKVVVVDDDKEVLAVIREMLEDLGCDVCCVRSPTEALVKVTTDASVGVLISDINMPVSGYELAEKVKEIRPAVKVWLLSGYAEREETNGYPLIRKPFTQADLVRAMS
jgi:CheY-like chemotaxis protein